MAGDVTLAAVLAFSGAARRICRALGDPLARLIDFRGDPYPFYEAIRDRGTLVHSRLGPYLTASHELCSAVLRDARFGVIPSSELPPVDLGLSGDGPHRIVDPVDESFLKLDPPEHTRLRRMVSSSFTPHALRSRSEAITAIVTEFLDRVDGRGGFDLMRDFAARVPIKVICGLLGASDTRHEQMAEWGTTLAAAVDGVRSVRQVRHLRATLAELNDFLGLVIDAHRGQPADDVVGALMAQPELSREDLLATSGLLLTAGFETTVNLIGNGVLALLDNPEARQRLIDDPDAAPAVVEEILRFDPPAQYTGRLALEPVELAGKTIATGQYVVLLTAAANRDPAVFADPHRFDIDRVNAADHLSFAAGIHYCLGAGLARMEGAIALRALFTRFPDLRLAGPVVRRPSRAIRGVLRMPVQAAVSANTAA